MLEKNDLWLICFFQRSRNKRRQQPLPAVIKKLCPGSTAILFSLSAVIGLIRWLYCCMQTTIRGLSSFGICPAILLDRLAGVQQIAVLEKEGLSRRHEALSKITGAWSLF